MESTDGIGGIDNDLSWMFAVDEVGTAPLDVEYVDIPARSTRSWYDLPIAGRFWTDDAADIER